MRASRGRGLRLALVGSIAFVTAGINKADCDKPPPPDSYQCAAPSGVDPWVLMASYDALPVHRTDRHVLFSSTDRGEFIGTPFGPDNKDNNNFLAVCGAQTELTYQSDDGVPCDPGADGYLLAKVSGEAGFISRMWFANVLDFVDKGYADHRLVIYVDDLAHPAIDVRIADLEAAAVPPFVEPLAGFRSGGAVSYVPIGFKHDLRVYMRSPSGPNDFFYYHVDVQLLDGDVQSYCPTMPQSSLPLLGLATSKFTSLGTNPNEEVTYLRAADPVTLEAEAETVVLDEIGQGTLKGVELSLPSSTYDDWDRVRLRIYWDGETEPAVDLPIRSLFGQELAFTPFDSLFLGHRVQDDVSTLYVYFPMPYASGTRISVLNDTPEALAAAVTVGWSPAPPPGAFGRFRATYAEVVDPLLAQTTYVVADLVGTGQIVGLLHTMEGHRGPDFFSSPMAILEGDPVWEIDGDPALDLLGTGSEEIADGAWYFDTGTFASAFAGATVKRVYNSNYRGEATFYRWYALTDPIRFQSSARYEQELGVYPLARADRFSAVTFYYLVP